MAGVDVGQAGASTFSCWKFEHGEWKSASLTIDKMVVQCTCHNDDLYIMSRNIRYFITDVDDLFEKSEVGKAIQMSYVAGNSYLRLFLMIRNDEFQSVVSLLTEVHNRKPIDHQIQVDLLLRGYVNNVSMTQRYYAELDKEAFIMYRHETDAKPMKIFFFYSEAFENVVERICLIKTDILKIDYYGQQAALQLQVETEAWKTALPLIKPLPKFNFLYQRGIPNDIPEAQGLTSIPIPNMEVKYTETENYQDSLVQSELNSYEECTDLDSDSEMGLMWAVAEADMTQLLLDGHVPGSSIESGGLDPNSLEHFRKCMDEISEEMLKQDYAMALSHYQGTKRLFGESTIKPLADFFKNKDIISMMKKIYIFYIRSLRLHQLSGAGGHM